MLKKRFYFTRNKLLKYETQSPDESRVIWHFAKFMNSFLDTRPKEKATVMGHISYMAHVRGFLFFCTFPLYYERKSRCKRISSKRFRYSILRITLYEYVRYAILQSRTSLLRV